jgi:hypothetical protein
MDMVDERLLEIRQYTGEGYRPVIDFNHWRVAILKYCEELLPERIKKMQRHDETDEVFVLLQGDCILFIGVGDQCITDIIPQRMEPLKLYNIKRSVWHTHTLSMDAVVLIVENQDTTFLNSVECFLSEEQQNGLLKLFNNSGMARG